MSAIRSLRWLTLSAAFLIISLIIVQPTSAASFIVTKTADTNDGACNADCSLREAITAANTAAGTDTITFDPTVFNPGTITLTSPLPTITQALNITGLGAALTIVDGDTVYRPFEIIGVSVTLSGLTISNGFSETIGGAIRVDDGSLTVTNSILQDNFASGSGGGIRASESTLTISNSMFDNNSTTASGGGVSFVDSSTSITITNSTFMGNIAANDGGGLQIDGLTGIPAVSMISGTTFTDNEGQQGGALLLSRFNVTITNSTIDGNAAQYGGGIDGLNANVILLNSTISNNTATGEGGGLVNFSGDFDVINSTVSGNSIVGSAAGARAGGLISRSAGSTTNIINSTIANNSAPTANLSGLVVDNVANSVTIQNSIVANNNGTNNCAFLSSGSLVDAGNNLDNGTSCGFGGAVGQNTNPNLGALANNGGSTRTMLPLVGSPAINAGSNAKAVDHLGAALTLDQRGAGYPRILDTTVDIGAVEVGCPTFPYTVQASDVFGLTNAIVCANSSAANSVINLTDSTYTLSAAFSGVNGLPPIVTTAMAGTLTINGNGATIARSNRVGVPSFRLFQVNSGGNLSLNSVTLSSGKLDNSSGGAGIFNSGTATITGSTISGNSSTAYGGGIANLNGTLHLINSTIANNSATGITASDGGGAIDSFGSSSSVLIINSTIAGNSAAQTVRSGIWIEAGAAAIQNTILANNGSANNCAVTGGAFTDAGNNLDSGVTCPFGGTSLSNANANLGTLADNGGATQTMALLMGSAAINAGDNTKAVNQLGAALTTDQRGAGFSRINGGTVDIGAYEAVVGSLNVQLTLQGRSNPTPHASYVMTTHVWIMPQSGGTPLYMQDFTSSTSAAFTIPNLPTGTYLFHFKGTHTLARDYVITINSGVNNKTTDLLFEGDASDNNTVSLTDFSLLASAFGKALGQPGYDPTVDFNHDNLISLVDFSLLASNYSKIGDGGVTS